MTNEVTSDLLNILGMVGVALLTVMIPVAVAIFTGKVTGTKKGNEKNHEDLDRKVLLEHVVKARWLPVYMLLIYAPLMLWGYFSFHSLWYQVPALLSWSMGIGGLVLVLFKSYQWMKGDNLKLRREYLKGLKISKNSEDTAELWRSVWQIDNMHGERVVFSAFSSTVDNLIQGDGKDIRTATDLMRVFNNFIDKRPIDLLVVVEEFLPNILKWNFQIWEKYHKTKGSDRTFAHCLELSWELSAAIKKAEERALTEDSMVYFMIHFESHVEKHKMKSVEGARGKQNYVESLMRDFFAVWAENIKTNEDVRGVIPFEWRITVRNLKSKNNPISRILFNIFAHWISGKILSMRKYDHTLSEIVYCLFPEVCPIMWSRILTFLMRHWESGKRMESLIKTPVYFSQSGRVRSGWVGSDDDAEEKWREKIEKERKAEEEETIDLALLCFRGRLSEEELNEYIADLEGIECSPDSDEEMHRKVYIEIFRRINVRRKELADG